MEATGILLLAAGLLAAPGAAEPRRPAPIPDRPAPASPPVLLVPPPAAVGSVRIDAMATGPGVDRVLFFLDGEAAGSDGRAPFRVRLDLAPAPGPRTVRAVALDRAGHPLGEHSVTFGGPEPAAFEVAIRRLTRGPASGAGAVAIDVEVDVAVPHGARLDRLELYRNGELLARLAEPPFHARLALPEPAPEDYLRAVAHLADGSTREDARSLVGIESPAGSGAAYGERLEVNLVEVFAVATGRAGGPVQGLGPQDFRVRLAGRELPIERFREARQVPLTLALLVDSSTSMRAIMEETREAAGRFLERVLAVGDRAFLVDVDTRPRLVQQLTGEPADLAAAFAHLEADGDTALYDAMVLALVELRRHAGRRALVVISDGEDSSSHLGLGRCLDLARRSGVPAYLLSVGGLDVRKTRPDRNLRLEAFARETGGRLYPVTSERELDRAYDEIGGELRSQYVLGVAADRALTAAELAGLEVEARDRRVQVRSTTRATAN
jgi:Ca-activated chloride channel family protein